MDPGCRVKFTNGIDAYCSLFDFSSLFVNFGLNFHDPLEEIGLRLLDESKNPSILNFFIKKRLFLTTALLDFFVEINDTESR